MQNIVFLVSVFIPKARALDSNFSFFSLSTVGIGVASANLLASVFDQAEPTIHQRPFVSAKHKDRKVKLHKNNLINCFTLNAYH